MSSPSTTYTHEIRLYPLGNFFFGGENYSDSTRKAFYYQTSLDVPQQTSLMGLIRYQLLLQNNLLPIPKSGSNINVVQLIGSESFDPGVRGSQVFGAIQKISPLYLINQNKSHHHFLQTVSKWEDNGLKTHEIPSLTMDSSIRVKTSTGGEVVQEDLSLLKGYSPKLGTSRNWLNTVTGKQVSNDDFYQEVDEQIGIYKTDTLSYRKTDDREGFFKMQYKRLKEGSSFAFFLSLSEYQSCKLESQPMVIFGKERSAFRMEVLPYPDKAPVEEVNLNKLEGGETLCLLSPARVEMEKVQHIAQFILGQEISFRCMKTRVQGGYNYYGNPRKKWKKGTVPNQPTMSGRYNLLDAGSILFLRSGVSSSDIISTLQDLTFETIGYNHYTLLNSSTR
ncbi:MAG: type III-B CRISPR module-associated Cmr3 family protein [Bacteroidota bacterium]